MISDAERPRAGTPRCPGRSRGRQASIAGKCEVQSGSQCSLLQLGSSALASRAVREEHPHVNPGWDSSAQPLAEFTDMRELQRLLKAQGYSYSRRPTTAQPGQRALSLWTRMGILFWSISTCELESYSRALCAVGERDTAERSVNQARRCGHEFLRRTMPHDSRGRSLRCRCGRQAAGAAIVTQP
jgi:hypothetical protein